MKSCLLSSLIRNQEAEKSSSDFGESEVRLRYFDSWYALWTVLNIIHVPVHFRAPLYMISNGTISRHHREAKTWSPPSQKTEDEAIRNISRKRTGPPLRAAASSKLCAAASGSRQSSRSSQWATSATRTRTKKVFSDACWSQKIARWVWSQVPVKIFQERKWLE